MKTIVYTVYDNYGLESQQAVREQICKCKTEKNFQFNMNRVQRNLSKGGFIYHDEAVTDSGIAYYYDAGDNVWAKVEVING